MRLNVKAHLYGKRLDLALKQELSLSRTRVQQAIKQGLCLLNGQIILEPDRKLCSGDQVDFTLPSSSAVLTPEKITAKIVWQDDDLVVCEKPPGLTAHPCPSCPENTLVQQLLDVFPQIADMGGERPGIVHRLDKDTSGLIMAALHERARVCLTEKFARHEVRKEYLCLVKGKPAEAGWCSKSIGRHPDIKTKMAIVSERQGRPAFTSWRRLRYFQEGDFSLLAVRIQTGRTHQIRVHMSALGYPLLGDKVYGTRAIARLAPRQMLHAWRLELLHPFNETRLSFRSLPPEDFMEAIMQNTDSTPLLVVTGKPGSGKSAVTELLAKRGYPAISADEIIAALYTGETPLTDWLKINLGQDIFNAEGNISKTRLFPILENNPGLKKEFESYAHELVFEKINAFWQEGRQKGASFVIAEIPLYFESRFQDKFVLKPLVLGVDCDANTRRDRLRNTRGWDDDKIAAIDSWQWPDAKKMAACDVVLKNMGNLNDLAVEVDAAMDKIEDMVAEKRFALAVEVAGLYQSSPDYGAIPGEKDNA